MSIPTTGEGLAALIAAFGIEAAKQVVELYKIKKNQKKDKKTKFG